MSPSEVLHNADYERLLEASIELCNYIGQGTEPAGQDMRTTMTQRAVREFRKAVQAAVRANLVDGDPHG